MQPLSPRWKTDKRRRRVKRQNVSRILAARSGGSKKSVSGGGRGPHQRRNGSNWRVKPLSYCYGSSNKPSAVNGPVQSYSHVMSSLTKGRSVCVCVRTCVCGQHSPYAWGTWPPHTKTLWTVCHHYTTYHTRGADCLRDRPRQDSWHVQTKRSTAAATNSFRQLPPLKAWAQDAPNGCKPHWQTTVLVSTIYVMKLWCAGSPKNSHQRLLLIKSNKVRVL